jgi:predicted SprT family Zn-dependent metalloprotease
MARSSPELHELCRTALHRTRRVHPNEKGSQDMVNKVWEVLTAKCIGQKAKHCCDPS